MDLNHLLLGDGRLFHGDQRADPTEDRQDIHNEDSHDHNRHRLGVGGLGNRGRISDQRDAEGGDHGAEGGHHLVNQAVDARDNAGHVSSGAVCLIVHHICQHRGGGGADHDLQSVLQHRQNDKEDQQGGRGNNRGRSGEKQNNHKGKVYIDTDPAPECNALGAAVLSGVFSAKHRENQSRKDRDHIHNRADTHITDDNSVEKRGDHRLTRDIHGQLIRGGGENETLQRFVVFKQVQHILPLDRLAFSLGGSEIFRLVNGGDANYCKNGKDCRETHEQYRGLREKTHGVVISILGQQHHRDDHGQDNYNHIVIDCSENAYHGALLRIVGDDRGDEIVRHVMERIADVIQKIEQDEHAHRVPLAAEPAVKAQQRESFNGPADDYKKADLSEAGVDLVNQQGNQRVGNSVKQAGDGHNRADQ